MKNIKPLEFRYMTMPDERYRAVVQTEKFLREILTTPRVPKAIKDGARAMLRHYPSQWDMRGVAHQCPEIFAENIEPLYRMVKAYSLEETLDSAVVQVDEPK